MAESSNGVSRMTPPPEPKPKWLSQAMMIRTMFAVLPKVMKSVLPKVSVQSVRSVWFLDVAWSDAFGVALNDAGAPKAVQA